MKRLQQIAFTKIKGVGLRTARQLLAHYGSLEEVFNASKKELNSLPFLRSSAASGIVSKETFSEAEQELAFIEKHQIQTFWINDDDYPKRLKQCEDAPILLYYKGNADLNGPRLISVVGTRNATSYGKRLCDELISDLRESGIQVVSGLAYGIDIEAHRASMKHAIPTIGVLGHGLDMVYPAAHRDVAVRMLNAGGLLTEYSSKTIPDRNNFPARNRIIAGLADITVVIEAAQKGGALITAELANSYNRDVAAFPGGVDQTYSAGCNYLIKTNRAHLIRHADDLLYLMGWEVNTNNFSPKQLQLIPPTLSKDEERVYAFLKEKEQCHVDEIAAHLDWPTSKLAMVLLEMEMSGVVLSLPGKQYKMP